MSTTKLRQALAAKQNELRLLQIEEKSIAKMESNIKVQLNRLRIEEMGLKNSILDSNVKSATNRDDGTKPSDAINFTGIKKIAAGGTTSSHTSQLSSVTSFSTIETPSNINKTDLNLMVPTPSGNPSLATIISTFQDVHNNISDEEISDYEEEKECLLEF